MPKIHLIMKLTNYVKYITLAIIPLISLEISAQESNISVIENHEFKELLKEKQRINSSITVNDRYKIQIYSGDNSTAKKHLQDLKKENKMLDATIIFNTPNYRVVAGNYKSKIEAEKALIDFQKKYSGAIILKPNK